MSETKSSSGGIGFTGALTILFIALKLTGVIGWSWWWVLSPIWISALVVAVILGVLGMIWLGVHLLDKRAAKKRWAKFGAKKNAA